MRRHLRPPAPRRVLPGTRRNAAPPEVGEGKQPRAGSERGPWRRARFPRVRVGRARSLYPDFRVSRGCRCRHVLSMRIADARELRGVAAEAGAGIGLSAQLYRGKGRMRSSRPDPPAGESSTDRPIQWRFVCRGQQLGHCHGLERRAIPGRCDGPPAGADWCLDTPESLRRAPGLPERRALARLGGRAICECPLHPTAVRTLSTGRNPP